MIDSLMEMGMETPFSGAADFSGMDGITELFTSQVIHQAFIDVNEEGTEAAAATVVIMKFRGDENPTFRADHPFVFLIQDRNTDNILLMGRVVDPAKCVFHYEF